MENLTRLNTQVDALISVLRSAQAETARLRQELAESRAAGEKKDVRIRSLEAASEEKDLNVLTLEDAISNKDAQLGELVSRIEQVLSALPQPVESVASSSKPSA
ncbi:hypothetical protein CCP3SC1_550019 [Gammaproteobacteria bacterium]